MTSIPLYPRGWFTVHAGLSKYVYQEFGAGVEDTFRDESLPEQYRVRFISDGDDWTEWGEAPKDHSRHVQWVTPFLAVAMDLRDHIEEAFAEDLIPIQAGPSRAHLGEVLTAISGSEDWATGDQLENLLARNDWNLDRSGYPGAATQNPVEVAPPMILKVKLGLTAYLTRAAGTPPHMAVGEFVMHATEALSPLSDPLSLGVRSHKVIDIGDVPEWVELPED